MNWSLDKSLGFLLNRTARTLKRALDTKLVPYGLTSTQFIVLVHMWEEDGIPLTQLGEQLDFDNPTVTGVVDRMERDSLLERRRDSNDRRVVKVYLTEKGKGLQSQIGNLAAETDAEAWDGTSEKQREEIFNFLNRIWKKMNARLD